MRNAYIVSNKLYDLERKKKRQLIWGLILTLFFASGIILAVVDHEEDLLDNLGFYAFCLIPSALLLYFAIRNGRRIASVHRYNAIFEQDRDGFVSIDELTQALGMPAQKMMKELEDLFRAGLFQNCTLQREVNPGVVLTDAVSASAGVRSLGFVNVKCASCGGTSRIRAGTVGVCEYCGSPLNARGK